jgi:TolB protein
VSYTATIHPRHLLAVAAVLHSAVPALAQKPAPAPFGIFRGESEVGRPSVLGAGTLRYVPRSRTYVVTGGGANMWATADHFHYVWIKLSGDVALEATVRFTGTAPASGRPDAHRKACLMVRQSLDSDSPYADAATHGDGLTSLQWRDAKGAVTHEVQSSVVAPERLRIEKRGGYLSMSVATRGGPFVPAGGAAKVALDGDFYVGLAVSAHDTTRLETATFSNVSLTRLPPLSGATTMVSTVETISLRSRDRRTAAVVTQPGPIGEAFWYPDTARMLYFRGALDRLFRVKADYPGQPTTAGRLAMPQPVKLVSGTCSTCVVADTGRRWSVAEGPVGAGGIRSTTLTVRPVAGGATNSAQTPVLSSLARWTPDGAALTYANDRDGQLYVVRATSPEPIRVTTRGRNAHPEFSPDGQWIYFDSDRSGTRQLWRIRLDGGAPEQLTTGEIESAQPHVSPDGRAVAFLSFDAGSTLPRGLRNARLRLLSLATGAVDDLAQFLGGEGTLDAYPWAPNGQYLAFVSYQLVPR